MRSRFHRRVRRAIDQLIYAGTEAHFSLDIVDVRPECFRYPGDPALLTQGRIGFTDEQDEISALPALLQVFLDARSLCRGQWKKLSIRRNVGVLHKSVPENPKPSMLMRRSSR
jgi:hypothetical protein